MATISFTIPDAQLTRVVNALCVTYGYQDTMGYTGTPPDLVPVPNPETKGQFAKRMIAEHIKNCVKQVEGGAATLQAQQTTNSAIDALGIV